MKKEAKMIHLTVPILNDEYKVHVLYGDASKAVRWVNQYYGEHYSVEDVDSFRGNTWSQEDRHPTIWVNLSQTAPFHVYATVAHEATHAINNIFRDIEETDSVEVYSHSVGAVVHAFEKSFEKNKKLFSIESKK